MQVVFRHVFYEPTGYGNAARQIAYALEDAGVDVKIEPMGRNYHVLDASEQARLDRMANRRLRQHRVLLTVDMPPKDKSQYKKTFSCLMWETTKVPTVRVQLANQFDALIVPNEFNRYAYRAGGTQVPIHIAPYGVNCETFTPMGPRERLGESDDVYLFLSVFGWSYRKGPDALIRAYLKEFHRDEPVCLVIKTHGLQVDKFEQQWFAELEQSVDKPNKPSIRLLTSASRDHDMASLYRGADCFVLPTRAEAFGMPFLESMACGKPVIATGWGGHTEFVGPSSGYLVPYRMVPARPLYYSEHYKSDQLWAEPDVSSLRVLMRRAFLYREECRTKAENGRRTAERWTWQRTANAFISAIETSVGESIKVHRQ